MTTKEDVERCSASIITIANEEIKASGKISVK
jgi:hypothetical protein